MDSKRVGAQGTDEPRKADLPKIYKAITGKRIEPLDRPALRDLSRSWLDRRHQARGRRLQSVIAFSSETGPGFSQAFATGYSSGSSRSSATMPLDSNRSTSLPSWFVHAPA